MRKLALRVVESEAAGDPAPDLQVREDSLSDLVGKPRFTSDRLYAEPPAGVVMGLAYTTLGGSALYIEVSPLPREGAAGTVSVTGQLGNVMSESSKIALNVAKRYVSSVRPESTFFKDNDLHLHVPEGATPKDGPSAGITMTTALLSLAMDVPVIPDLAMTGELSLTGKVMAIGGIKEK